jgi:hypothetical protein
VSTRRIAALLATTLAMALPAPGARAEDRLNSHEPEAWAMFYFATATDFAGLGTPREREPWSVEVFLDLGDIPHLGAEERTVGFSGTKTEDLNKAPIFGRPGITIGLPWKLSVQIGYIPPVKIFGVRPHLLSLAIERPLFEEGPWTIGARVHSQVGNVRGDYTCPGQVLNYPPGSPGNDYGCEHKSNDTAIQRSVGLELSGSYRIEKLRDLAPYLTLGTTYLNDEFHVHALTFGEQDRTKLGADTWVFALGAGATMPLTDTIRAGIGLTYTPLWVTRPPGTDEELDGILQVRATLSWQFL